MLVAHLRWASIVTLPCASLVAQGSGVVTRDSAGIEIVESITPLWTATTAWRVDATPLLTIGAPDQSVDAQFGMLVGAHRLSDGRIAVADYKAHEIRVFDAKGALVKRMGRKGEGPGDFMGLSGLLGTPGDTIIGFDYQSYRFTYFNPDGHVLRTLQIERPLSETQADGSKGFIPVFSPMGRFADGTMLLRTVLGRMGTGATGVRQDSLRVHHLTGVMPGKSILSLFNQAHWTYQFADGGSTGGEVPFGRKGQFTALARSFVVSDGERYEIREYSPTGKLQRILRVRRAAPVVTANDIPRFKSAYLADVPEKYRERSKPVVDWLPFPKTMPAYDSLGVDAAGRIWARNPSAGTAPQRWDVFDTSGRYLGAVDLPKGIEVIEIGRDFILARAHGPDDEDLVRLYRLHGG